VAIRSRGRGLSIPSEVTESSGGRGDQRFAVDRFVDRTLDGSRAARIALLAGMIREELDSVGGVEEDA
jgi:hypothetical protein